MLMHSEDMSIEDKIDRVWEYTSDTKLYAKYYFRLGSIIQVLALKYPDYRGVIDLYGSHLIMGGPNERQMALDYLRRHLSDASTIPDDYVYVMQLEEFLGCSDLLFEDLESAFVLYPNDLDILSFAGYIYVKYGYHHESIKI